MNLDLLYPVFVQVALTFALAAAMGPMRYLAVSSRQVKPRDIIMGQRNWPVRVQLVSNAYENQLGLPVLFYAGTALALIVGAASPALVVLAWAYKLAVVRGLI